jgi:hypothetical protein
VDEVFIQTSFINIFQQNKDYFIEKKFKEVKFTIVVQTLKIFSMDINQSPGIYLRLDINLTPGICGQGWISIGLEPWVVPVNQTGFQAVNPSPGTIGVGVADIGGHVRLQDSKPSTGLGALSLELQALARQHRSGLSYKPALV